MAAIGIEMIEQQQTKKRIKDFSANKWLQMFRPTKWPCDCTLPHGELQREYGQINYSVNAFDLCIHIFITDL